MNILDRYLYRTVIVYTLMVMAVLMTLGALFVFISQQRDISASGFTTADALLYTLLNLPQQAFELLPIGALIGALMGLGNLAGNSELVITRASGVSIWRVAWPVSLAGLTLAVFMYAIGEFIAPPMAQYATREKAAATMSGVSFAGGQGAWIKDGNRILRVQTGDLEQVLGGVYVFELAGPSRLAQVQRAQSVSIAERGRWRLENVNSTSFTPEHLSSYTRPEVVIASSINPEFLGLAALDPDLLTLRGLSTYIEHLRHNNLNTASYEIGFWSRIARMAAIVVVVLLSLPFVFGPLRSTGAGTRTVIGVLLGVVFFLANRTIENGGELFALNPALVGWLPTAVIGVGTLIAVARTR
ncbi:MAG: LPS export ABC transporter permease LptG [Proteobacteria bacterium]|nr:LPS export ABC transporter permease LptG [Pseudomonadota bacterium]